MDDKPMMEEDLGIAKAKLEAIQSAQGTMGWRWFIEEVGKEMTLIKDALVTASRDDYRFLQGRYDAMQQISVFEDVIDNYLKIIEDAEKGGDDASV